MKGAAVHASAHRANQPLGARDHLVRGAARESEEQYSLRSRARRQQMGNTIDQRSCFAGSSAGDDEERPLAIHRRGRLFRIQLGGEITNRGIGSRCLALARMIEPGALDHRQRLALSAAAMVACSVAERSAVEIERGLRSSTSLAASTTLAATATRSAGALGSSVLIDVMRTDGMPHGTIRSK